MLSKIEATCMGTEIRTFTSLKEINEYLTDQLDQYRALFEDYSQWLGSLLRSYEEAHKNEEWYQKSAALQKNLRGPSKKAAEKAAGKKGGKGKKAMSSVWVQSGNVLLSSTEQGQAEVLFEAIEKIGDKIQDMEKFTATVQQLERIGLGKNVNYIVYIEDDIPRRIVLRAKSGLPEEEAFKFATELSVPAIYSDFSNK
jgi:predicted DNA-binding protein